MIRKIIITMGINGYEGIFDLSSVSIENEKAILKSLNDYIEHPIKSPIIPSITCGYGAFIFRIRMNSHRNIVGYTILLPNDSTQTLDYIVDLASNSPDEFIDMMESNEIEPTVL